MQVDRLGYPPTHTRCSGRWVGMWVDWRQPKHILLESGRYLTLLAERESANDPNRPARWDLSGFPGFAALLEVRKICGRSYTLRECGNEALCHVGRRVREPRNVRFVVLDPELVGIVADWLIPQIVGRVVREIDAVGWTRVTVPLQLADPPWFGEAQASIAPKPLHQPQAAN